MRTFPDIPALIAAKGDYLGHSEWHTIDQQKIDLFAEATGDHQWIHVDSKRAAAGPFGKTIGHGYLTLSLLPSLMKDIYTIENYRMGINYGVNRVRFTSVVPVDSRIRVSAEMLDVSEVGERAVQLVTKLTVEIDGSVKPACVAESVARYYF